VVIWENFWQVCCSLPKKSSGSSFVAFGVLCLVFGLVGLWGISGQNWSPVWSKVCFGGDLLGTILPLVEEDLVHVSPCFEFVCSSFGILSLSSLGETGVTGLGKRSDRFWCVGFWLSLAKPV
jgi:hypothetical protein